MKRFVFAVALLAVLVGGGFWYQDVLTDFSDDIAQECTRLSNLARDADFDVLEAEFADFEAYWEKKKTMLSYFVDHQHLNDVGKAVDELGVAVRAKAVDAVFYASARIVGEAKNITEDELLRPENIF